MGQYTFKEYCSRFLSHWKVGIPVFYLIAILVFWNKTGTSFTDDSLEWLVYFQKYGWTNFWTSYEMTSIYWMHDLFSNGMYLLFGKNSFAWYYVILFFHSVAAYFWYRFIFEILKPAKTNYEFAISFLSSLIFLASPYHLENVMWIATYHYNISALYLTYCLYHIVRKNGQLTFRDQIVLFLPFPFMLTMHEICFFFPILFWFLIAYCQNFKFNFQSLRKQFLYLLPYALSCIGVLFLTKIIKGSYIPHYGEGHIQNHSLYNFLWTMFNYVEKHVLFVHNMPHQFKEKLYDIDKSTMTLFFVFVGISSFVYISFSLKKNKSLRPLGLFLFLFLVLFVPFSNMYFFWHFVFQNDRLGYFFSLTSSVIFVYLIVKHMGKLGIIISTFFLIISVIILRFNISAAEEAHDFYHQILTPSYEPYLDKKPIILNLPYNYKGIYIYRHKYRMPTSMYFFYEKNIDYTYCVSTPFFSSTDSVVAVKLSDTMYRVHLSAPGSWLMNETLGGVDYENDRVRVDYEVGNQSATIYLKKYDRLEPVLYCTGNRGFVELGK
jgi:hypothetical protein